MQSFDFRESTMSFDYVLRTVEFYFTRESNYNSCIKRNPNYIIAEDLKPGYRIVYPFNQVRTPEFLLRTTNKTSNAAISDTQEASK